MKEGEDVPSEDDEISLNKKRTREEKEAEDRVSFFSLLWHIKRSHFSPLKLFYSIMQKSRGNYRCSKCNVPKKGHVCPYQPRFRRRDQAIDGGMWWTYSRMSKRASSTTNFLSLPRTDKNCKYYSNTNSWNPVRDGWGNDRSQLTIRSSRIARELFTAQAIVTVFHVIKCDSEQIYFWCFHRSRVMGHFNSWFESNRSTLLPLVHYLYLLVSSVS